MNCITIKNLKKRYDEKVVFSDLSLSIECGAVTCLMGASGSGKTTLLRILAGLEKKNGGEIENPCKNISFMFQEDRLCEDFSSLSNIRFVVGKKMSDREIRAHLSALGLGEYADKCVRSMSGGMKRRVALARALCAPFDLLLLDEPFKGLDESLKLSVMEYIKKCAKGKTVLCVTHDESDVQNFGAAVIRLS